MRQLPLGVTLRANAVFANFAPGANAEIIAALEKLGTRIDAMSCADSAAFIDLKRLSAVMKGETARR